MALLLRKNFAKGTISVSLSAGDVQLTVGLGHNLPTAVGYFMLVIWDESGFPDPADDPKLEIVKASYSGVPNVYDILRAQESTLDVDHEVDSRAALHYTAGMSENDLTAHTHPASDIVSGVIADARIAQSNVTQHQAAIDHGSIAGLGDDDHSLYHTDARAATWLANNHETAYTHADIALNTTHRGLVAGNPHVVTPTELGLVIGTDVQAHGAVLDDLNTLGANTFTGDPVNDFLVGTAAGTLVWQYGATARTSMGVGTGDSPTFAGLHINSAEVDSVTLLTLESDISNNNEYNEILFKVGGSLNYGAIRSCVGAVAGDSYMSFFTTTDGGTLVRKVTIQHNGKVGLGTYNPETLFTMVSAAPYLTLYNITEEDTDGGGESRLIYKREDGAGTGTACFQFEASHDGSGANDQLGKGVWSVNTGAGLVEGMRLDSSLTATFAGVVQATDFAKTGWPIVTGATFSFDNATKVFTVTDGGSAYYYIGGVKYILGGNKTVDLDDIGIAEGLWHIYFDGATLTASQAVWSFRDEDKALVAILYWDNTNNKEIFLGWEAHTFHMNGSTHARLHYAGGARWEIGLLVSDAGSEHVNVSAGDIWDEDLNIPISDEGGGLFSQVLSPAQLPIYYREGASAWRKYEIGDKAAVTDVGYLSGGDLKWNDATTTWSNETVGLNNYVAYYVVATNEQTEPIALIMGQRVDNKFTEAKVNNVFAGLSLAGLPFEEMVVLARLILKDTGTYTLEEVLDLRAYNVKGNITSPLISQHAGLGGLNWSSAGHYFDAAVDFNAQNISNIGTVGCGVITQSGATLAATYQPLHANLTSLATLSYAAAAFVKMTGANTFALRTLQETSDDLEATIDHDNLLNFAANEHFLQSAITALGTIAAGVWEGTSIAVGYTDAKCTDALADQTSVNETSHALVLVDGDFGSAGLMNTDGAGVYTIKAIGTDVQAYHTNLAAIAGGTWTGAASITTLGTIATVGNITIADGGTIGNGVQLAFDDTNDFLEITGCKVCIGGTTPFTPLHIVRPAAGVAALDPDDVSSLAIFIPACSTIGNYQPIIGVGEGANILSVAICTVDEGGGAAQGLSIHTGNATAIIEQMRVRSSGNIGIATPDPTGKLDIAYGRIALVLGADLDTTTRTNVTSKFAAVGTYHYTNAEVPVAMFYGSNAATINSLSFGGGLGYLNTATRIRFYTAANTTTRTGTIRFEINNDNILFENSLKLKEQAAADGDTAAYGQLWVDNSVPDKLRFTDDAGNDFYAVVSDGDTGGADSAGAGKQYVEMEIAGSVYKVLHDGTV